MKNGTLNAMMMILGLSAAGMPGTAHAGFAPADQVVSRTANTMVYIAFGNGLNLIVSPDQLLMTSSGLLARADKLTTETLLMDREGRAVEIKEVHFGEYRGGVHHIATDT